ncbi:MAG TPA: SRPBCC domain-containing protein [Allosphingosinicella sp.]|nr:SRPBCC domain-containing protein [Allosphingosinicella sp.]
MDLKFKITGFIARPVHDVFEAVADPDTLSNYFTTGGAKGRIEQGATVTWDFADFPGAFPVEVVEVVPDRRIVLKWEAYEGPPPDAGGDVPAEAPTGYQTTVTMTFEPQGENRTLVTIAEEGWRETERGLQGSYGNCQGWAQMLAALKAWVEYGINLREGMYV